MENQILYYIGIFSLAFAVLSGFRVLCFLKDKGIEKSSIYSFNPGWIFKYMEITKNENGRFGIWAKTFFLSLIVGLISIVLLIVT